MQQRKITFIGAGNMAHAIITGLISAGYPANYITACSPTATNRDLLVKKYGINGKSDNSDASKHADVIILAVKPQIMETVCQPLKEQVNFANKLVLTIAAGIPVKRYQQYLAPNINLVRVMPNTPSLVGQGVSGLYAMDCVSEDDKTFATELMASVGKVFWLTNEATINDIIAVTGSAPAYFFLFMESMQQEAERLGFDSKTARELVLYTAQGSAALSASKSDLSFATLREQVTSKGGTTAKALEQFYQANLPQIVTNAMRAAIRRAEEMEKQF
ncbi:MAG TPA: pyrroline-5-carboxylate reductase [Arsenophonus nasoniae]|uniref:pyrroline-5-carboxylate reductase n=1 Tax=Arsenophonus nasoniae TaxID=638 RepID=UPI00387A7932